VKATAAPRPIKAIILSIACFSIRGHSAPPGSLILSGCGGMRAAAPGPYKGPATRLRHLANTPLCLVGQYHAKLCLPSRWLGRCQSLRTNELTRGPFRVGSTANPLGTSYRGVA
jgi:hypothetical protein